MHLPAGICKPLKIIIGAVMAVMVVTAMTLLVSTDVSANERGLYLSGDVFCYDPDQNIYTERVASGGDVDNLNYPIDLGTDAYARGISQYDQKYIHIQGGDILRQMTRDGVQVSPLRRLDFGIDEQKKKVAYISWDREEIISMRLPDNISSLIENIRGQPALASAIRRCETQGLAAVMIDEITASRFRAFTYAAKTDGEFQFQYFRDMRRRAGSAENSISLIVYELGESPHINLSASAGGSRGGAAASVGRRQERALLRSLNRLWAGNSPI